MLKLFRRSIVRNTSWILLGQGASLGIQAGYFVLLARLLGSQQYGIYVGAAALVSVVSQFGTMGAGLVFLRHVSVDRNRASKYWGNLLLSALVFGPLLVALTVAIGSRILSKDSLSLLLLVALGDCLFGSIITAIAQLFQTFEEMHTTAGLSLAGNAARLAVAISMWIAWGHVTATRWAFGAAIATTAVALYAVWRAFRRIGRPQFSFRHLSSHVAEGVVFAVGNSTMVVYNDIDKIIMGHLGMDRANGAYALAYRVINIGTMPFSALYSASAPKFFRDGAKGLSATLPLVRKLIWPTTLVGILGAALMFLSAPLIPLIIGNDFQTTVAALRWLCLIPVFRNYQWCAGDALAGAGFQNLRLYIQTGAALFNLGANLYVIPRYSWLGAAWTSVATDGLLALTLWVAILWIVRYGSTDVRPPGSKAQPSEQSAVLTEQALDKN